MAVPFSLNDSTISPAKRNSSNLLGRTPLLRLGLLFGTFFFLFALPLLAQTPPAEAPTIIVRPGAPGKPTQVLPLSTRASIPQLSQKDVEFMQGMITHHAQAVEMTDLIAQNTQNKDIRLLGARISQSQSDEMRFMRRWLEIRGQPVSAPMTEGHGHMSSHHKHMPGMLTQKQMDALKKARGADFDRLFLTGMIQHHKGALVMVEELFGEPGAGHDAELFNFASDVESGQRAEINTMETMLAGNP